MTDTEIVEWLGEDQERLMETAFYMQQSGARNLRLAVPLVKRHMELEATEALNEHNVTTAGSSRIPG